MAKPTPTVFTCEVCNAENPRWIRSIDRSAADFAYRRFYGFPGPTSHPARYCDDPECERVICERYGPPGNEHAFSRLVGSMLMECHVKGAEASDR